MKITGIDATTNAPVAVTFGKTIEGIEPLPAGVSTNRFLSPGWIDLQVNGCAGVDYNSPDASPEEIARSIRFLFSTGVTRFYPTIITGPPERTLAILKNLAAAKRKLPEGPAIEGFHVEGPHISPEDGPRGAHPREWVRPPNPDEFHRWQEAAEGNVRLVTLSPEWPDAPRYIEVLVQEGVVASIGHTKATSEQIAAAVEAGATLSTHLGNGAHDVLPRHPNYIWDQLAEDRLSAGFIADGIHLPAAFLKVAFRAKGAKRAILVTDAVMPAGCKPGRFAIGGVEIELHPDDHVTLADGRGLAGSALQMDRAVENTVRLTGTPLEQAIAMATTNPARALSIPGRQRGLAPGERADLVEFHYDPETISIRVRKTYLDGELVYSDE